MKTATPLVVVTGPTASGKSAVALQLAKEFGGEIICADSRTVYRYMDIATAKPTPEDRAVVPHWGLDLIDPGTRFTAADFKEYATQKIAEIRQRGAVPFLVGGTGLYIDGVIFDYQFSETQQSLREAFESRSLEELVDYCNKNNITLPENSKNRRYVLRAIEQGGVNNKRKQEPIDNTIIVGITTNMDDLSERIAIRAADMFADGVVEEATMLGNRFGWDSEAMTGNMYPIVRKLLAGEVTEAEAKELFIRSDRRLAKRQRTWLKRNPFIHWGTRDEVYAYLVNQLKAQECAKK